MSMCQRRYTLFNSKDFHAIVSKNKHLLQNKENKRKKEKIKGASRQGICLLANLDLKKLHGNISHFFA